MHGPGQARSGPTRERNVISDTELDELVRLAIDGDSDGVNPGTAHHAPRFEGMFERRVFAGAGHNLPQERPAEWSQAVLDVRKAAS